MLLREHARSHTSLRCAGRGRNDQGFIMFGVSDRSNKHVHAMDKWDFVAFALDGLCGTCGKLLETAPCKS